MACVENRFIGESGRLIADIIEISDVLILLLGLKLQSGNKNLAQSVAVILPTTFFLKEGLAKEPLFRPVSLSLL